MIQELSTPAALLTGTAISRHNSALAPMILPFKEKILIQLIMLIMGAILR